MSAVTYRGRATCKVGAGNAWWVSDDVRRVLGACIQWYLEYTILFSSMCNRNLSRDASHPSLLRMATTEIYISNALHPPASNNNGVSVVEKMLES